MADKKKKALGFHPLDRPALMAAVGRVTVRHSFLDYSLKMTIRLLADISPEEARRSLAFASSTELRKWVGQLGAQGLGKGQALLKLRALMQECAHATDRRNEYVHAIWTVELFGTGKGSLFDAMGKVKPLPSVKQLNDLDSEIARLVEALGEANRTGFVSQGLKSRAEKLKGKAPDGDSS